MSAPTEVRAGVAGTAWRWLEDFRLDTLTVVEPGRIADTEFAKGTPADVAEAVAWSASAGAAHVSGQVVQVNGGAERGRRPPAWTGAPPAGCRA